MYEIKIICFNMTECEMILLDISCTKFDVPDYRSWKIIQHRISQQYQGSFFFLQYCFFHHAQNLSMIKKG